MSAFLNPLSSETRGSIGTKLGKNVHWMVLSKFYRFFFFCLIGLERPKGIKKSVVCLCMWWVYFSTNLDGGFLMFLITCSLYSMSTDFLWLLLFPWYKGVKIGSTPKTVNFYSSPIFIVVLSLDSLWNFLPAIFFQPDFT